MSKICTGPCGRPLELSAFGDDANSPDGHNARCKECRRAAWIPRSQRARRDTLQGAPVDMPPAPRVVPETIEIVEEHRLKARVHQLEAQTRSLLSQLADARAMGDLARDAGALSVPGIVPRERSGKVGDKREATALVLASDWHIEEEVRPERVENRNRYNLEISERRMTRFFEAARYSVDFNRQIFTIRDMVLWLGGDMITNYLHEDNVETNLLSPVQAIAWAQQCIGDGIRYLLADPGLERLVIPCNDGNHGRTTDKMRAAARKENSIEWLLYTMLAREFAGESRVQFQIFEGPQLYLDVYGRTVRFTHGDTVNYHGGVGGITIPLLKAVARWDTVKRADLTCLGHFHQYLSLPDLIVNGSLIGYNSYAMQIGARFEAPSQAFTILDPARFKSISMPLWVADRSDDATNKE